MTRYYRLFRQAMTGPQVLAFLPALCLAAYWAGGEMLLILCALTAPLLHATTGGFGGDRAGTALSLARPSAEAAAERLLDQATARGQVAACLQLDLHGLDEVARTLGDAAVEDARTLILDRLTTQLREGDLVFQTGETRVLVLLAPSHRLRLDAALEVAKRLRAAVEEPVALNGTTRFLTVATGLCLTSALAPGATPTDWIDAAAQALAEAQANGPSATRAWSARLSRRRKARACLRDELRVALDTGQIQAFFQPQIAGRGGRVTGVEALARWDHPKLGLVAPGEFLRALEESGQMDRLGATMLVQSLAALQRWDMAGLDIPAVSVNFCAGELRNPALPDKVKWELDRFGLTPQRLGIEVLESVVADLGDGVMRRNLCKLAGMGCRIDLDDFGTGHASITTLQRFPVQRVKIDRSFVSGVDRNEEARRMLAAILGMAERLRLETVGEGVETVEEQSVLCELGCNHLQGFLVSEPMPLDEVEPWVMRRQEAMPTTAQPDARRRLQ